LEHTNEARHDPPLDLPCAYSYEYKVRKCLEASTSITGTTVLDRRLVLLRSNEGGIRAAQALPSFAPSELVSSDIPLRSTQQEYVADKAGDGQRVGENQAFQVATMTPLAFRSLAYWQSSR
jgi:hypothetical protein